MHAHLMSMAWLRPALVFLCTCTVALCIPQQPASGGLLNVKSFGAVGDGVQDDSTAIQRALNATTSGRTLWFPAGIYCVSTPLQLAGARRLLGEGRQAVTVVAGKRIPSILVLPGRAVGGNATDVCTGFSCPPSFPASARRTNGVSIEGITFDANMMSDFAVFGGALTRSSFIRAGFHNARVAGLYIGYGWINEVFQCSFAGSTHEQSLVGLWLDFACNSINVLDSMFEGHLGVGIVANQGSVVRIEGNTIENMGGPAVIANMINSLTIRSNYFEGNFQRFHNWTFTAGDGGPPSSQSVCSDVIVNGDVHQYSTPPTQASSLSLSQFAVAATTNREGAIPPGTVVLNNARPCNGVILEANFHNPSGNPLPYCSKFAGAFVSGATGLRSESNECADCDKYGRDYHGDNRTCTAIATGVAPSANASLSRFRVDLNTGDFAHGQHPQSI